MTRDWFTLKRKEADLALQLQDGGWSLPILFSDQPDIERTLLHRFGSTGYLPGMIEVGGQCYFVRGTEADLKGVGFHSDEVNAAKRTSTYTIRTS